MDSVISFDCFFENPEDLEAKLILQRERERQNRKGSDGLYNPITDLSGLSQKEYDTVYNYENREVEKARKETELRIQIEKKQAESSGCPVSPGVFWYNIQTLRNLSGKKNVQVNSYALMNQVLNEAIIRTYKGNFYLLEKQVYRPLGEDEVRRFLFFCLEAQLADGKTSNLITSVLSLMHDNPYICARSVYEGSDKVFFTNGSYCLSDHRLCQLDLADFFVTYIPFDLDYQVTDCPVFKRFLWEISGGDCTISNLIWEMIGYLLVPDMAAKVFFVLQGAGDTGKSVLGNLIQSCFNSESVSNLDIFRLKDKFSTSALKGKRLNISMDLPCNRISREAIGTIKMLTGGDVITIEEKHRNVEPYRPACKFLFGSNFPLMPADNDPAFLNRIVMIPFRFPVPKERQDKGLLDKLKAERSAIVVQALEHYLALRDRNYVFPKVEGVQPVTGYVAESDVLQGFLNQCCILGEGHYAFTDELLEAYNEFREAKGLQPISDAASFSRDLGGFCQGRITRRKKRRGSSSLNGYDGIALLSPEMECAR